MVLFPQIKESAKWYLPTVSEKYYISKKYPICCVDEAVIYL